MKWAEFLTLAPPGRHEKNLGDFGNEYVLNVPPILLECDSQLCDGPKMFDGKCRESTSLAQEQRFEDRTLYYICRHCRSTQKTFFVRVKFTSISMGEAIKIGEWPSFGSRIPSRVITLIGPDRDLFLKGKRAEDQGLGIAAFAYYRRIVENQKNRIIDEILRVALHINARDDLIKKLEKAKDETQFKKAIETIKDGVPEVLKIKGHNPLTLLHTPLSQGLHELSDEQCLELARSIRIILTDLAEKIEQAMKNQAEINKAVSRLLKTEEKTDD